MRNDITQLQLEKCTQEQVVLPRCLLHSCNFRSRFNCAWCCCLLTPKPAVSPIKQQHCWLYTTSWQKGDETPKPSFYLVRVALRSQWWSNSLWGPTLLFFFSLDDLKRLAPLRLTHLRPLPVAQRTARFNMCWLFEEQICVETDTAVWEARKRVCLFLWLLFFHLKTLWQVIILTIV